jgi:glycosyltransferase involved in cell wall biosynthesis
MLKRTVATVLLFLVYRAAQAFSKLRGRKPASRPGQRRGILLIGTFHNPNWLYAHVEPIARSGCGPVRLVCDEPVGDIPGVEYCCPPPWAQRVFSRAVAKLVWAIRAMRAGDIDFVMGYHVFPAGVIALVVARAWRLPAAFQVTSGELELEGGGWHAENRLLTALGGPSATIERAVVGMTREFDLLVVRGTRAQAWLRDAGCENAVALITGSVHCPERVPGFGERRHDVVFVGRLTEYKRPDRMVEVLRRLRQAGREFRALVIGDGPDRGELTQASREAGLEQCVTWAGQLADVPAHLLESRVFLLTSRWEGVSIAMLEAMACGCVPVVSDVGDLRDVVADGENGYVLPGDDIDGYVARLEALLSDRDHWERLSSSARATARQTAGKDVVARRWSETIEGVRDAFFARQVAVPSGRETTDA